MLFCVSRGILCFFLCSSVVFLVLVCGFSCVRRGILCFLLWNNEVAGVFIIGEIHVCFIFLELCFNVMFSLKHVFSVVTLVRCVR